MIENKETNLKSEKRRTKKEMEETVWAAFERLVIAEGFNSITLVKLAREAGIKPSGIYRRFGDMDDLFEQYARKNDFWLKKSISISPDLSPKENMIKMLTYLIDNLYDNEIMQRILLWVLTDTNKVTRQIALGRDIESHFLINYFSKGLQNSGLNINVVNAIIVSGIYYLIMYRKIAPFSTVDFSTEEGKEQMKQTVRDMVNRMID